MKWHEFEINFSLFIHLIDSLISIREEKIKANNLWRQFNRFLHLKWFMWTLFAADEVKVNKHNQFWRNDENHENHEYHRIDIVGIGNKQNMCWMLWFSKASKNFKPIEARPIFNSSLDASRHKSCFTSHKSSIAFRYSANVRKKDSAQPNSYVNLFAARKKCPVNFNNRKSMANMYCRENVRRKKKSACFHCFHRVVRKKSNQYFQHCLN